MPVDSHNQNNCPLINTNNNYTFIRSNLVDLDKEETIFCYWWLISGHIKSGQKIIYIRSKTHAGIIQKKIIFFLKNDF